MVISGQIVKAMAEAVALGRQTEAGLRPTTVEILARTLAPDGMGGVSEIWTVAATVQGRVQPSGREPQSLNLAGMPQIKSVWEFVLADGVNIPNTARLRANGVTYEIIDTDEPRSFSVSQKILCYEVR